MKTKSSLLVAAGLLCAAAPLARAGLYVKAGGFYNQAGDIQIANTAAFKSSLENTTGFSASAGWKLSYFRLEAELQALRSGAAAGSNAAGALSVVGGLKETTGFGNLFVDFPSILGLAPYVGAGLGYARINLDELAGTRPAGAAPVARFAGSGSVFGYQGVVGLQLHLFGAATLNAGYRIVKRQDLAVRDVLANAQQTLQLGSNRVFELGIAIGF